MNTKLSVALLSGLSLFLSVGAFAVSDEASSDYLNWSYAMGDLATTTAESTPIVNSTDSLPLPSAPKADPRKCTAGCPGRAISDDLEPLTLTYEDEAAPIAERIETFSTNDRYVTPAGQLRTVRDSIAEQIGNNPVSQRMPPEPVLDSSVEPTINTQYIQAPTKVQYPITRQYPISVQYPLTVQRNMTVEQPVIMQQPVIVRRPVVMQQDITVQRQPAVIQQQPVVMQQQPTFVQQQPVMIQAPAQPINPMMLPTFGYMPQPTVQQVPTNQPQVVPYAIPVMQAVPTVQPVQAYPVMQQMPMMGGMPIPGAQQYYVQGQVTAQPTYVQPSYAPAPTTTDGQQAGYTNSTY